MDALPLDHGGKVEVPRDDIEEYRRALDALRRANPGIVIDGDDDALDWPGERLVPEEYETLPEGMVRRLAVRAVSDWKKGTAFKKAPLPKPVGGN